MASADLAATVAEGKSQEVAAVAAAAKLLAPTSALESSSSVTVSHKRRDADRDAGVRRVLVRSEETIARLLARPDVARFEVLQDCNGYSTRVRYYIDLASFPDRFFECVPMLRRQRPPSSSSSSFSSSLLPLSAEGVDYDADAWPGAALVAETPRQMRPNQVVASGGGDALSVPGSNFSMSGVVKDGRHTHRDSGIVFRVALAQKGRWTFRPVADPVPIGAEPRGMCVGCRRDTPASVRCDDRCTRPDWRCARSCGDCEHKCTFNVGVQRSIPKGRDTITAAAAADTPLCPSPPPSSSLSLSPVLSTSAPATVVLPSPTTSTTVAERSSLPARSCLVCGQATTTFCGRCRATYYCSSDHQRAHWIAAHRAACVAV
jgi:hypothetical protein